MVLGRLGDDTRVLGTCEVHSLPFYRVFYRAGAEWQKCYCTMVLGRSRLSV